MQIRGKGVSYRRVCAIVADVSYREYGSNVIVHPDAKPAGVGDYGFSGRLRTITSRGPGTRTSAGGLGTRRHGPHVCWHAYRDVMRAILTNYPDATIITMHARYRGLAGFEATYPGTADRNIGSEFAPAYMPDLCECDE